ncbi:MAG: hypothetical protein ABMB14_18275, partial [Myxococcota bacterium]
MTDRIRLGVWIAALVLLVAVATGLRRTQDLASLLPSDGALAKAASAALSSRAAGLVIVEVDGTGADRPALVAAVHAVEGAAVGSGRFDRVRGHVDLVGDGRVLREVALAHAVELLPEDVLRDAVSDAGIDRALAGWKARLAGPAGSMVIRGLAEDPLDLAGLVLQRLRATAGPWDVHPDVAAGSGLLLDAAGLRALVILTPAERALAAAEDRTLVDTLHTVTAASPLPARWFGGPRVATDMAASVQRDVTVSSALAAVALLAVLVVGFRSGRAVVGLVAPLVTVVAAVGAALALRSPVHGISFGFGGALLGIAVDYWIHLHVTASRRYDGADPALRREAAAEIRAPLAMSAATTIAAFGFLLLSRYPVVRDLGASGVAAVLAALVGTGVIGPVVYRWTGGKHVGWAVPRLPRWTAWAAIAGTVALGLAATGTTFDGDPRHLIAV